METTLHRQLKQLYASDESQREVSVEGFRIDAVDGERLIEVQHAALSAIRHKIASLLQRHEVLVVKPLAARTLLVKRRGRKVATRYSPKRRTVFDLFDELVNFLDVFPHPRLTIEVLLIEQEELRRSVPPRGRWGRNFVVDDRRLRQIQSSQTLRTPADLTLLLPEALLAANAGEPFTTADIARAAAIPRWLAQKMAYCLRQTGAVVDVGKRGRARLHRVCEPSVAAA